MTFTLLQVAFILLWPLVALELARRNRILGLISPVFLAYIGGMIVAHQPFLSVNQDVSTQIAQATIPLAIPLLLFATNFSSWLTHARPAALSFGLAIVSIMTITIATAPFFADQIEESWKIAGMLVGIYTGGTPNMASIGAALQVNNETYLLVQAAQILAVGVYMIFMISGAAQHLLLLFLPAFKASDNDLALGEPNLELNISALPFRDMGLGFVASIIIVAISLGISLLFTGGMNVIIILLSVTSLGIGGSFIPAIRGLQGSYALGDYFILMFCVSIGTLIRIDAFLGADLTLLYYCLIVQTGAIVLHYILAYFFKIDTDTVIITSAAGVFGPAFIGMVANALNNRRVILSGLTTGLVGFAVGNYLGLVVAYLLQP